MEFQSLVDPLNYLALKYPWVIVAIVIFRETATWIKNIRDAIDKTPDTDDTPFERFATIVGKAAKGVAGFRPKAPNSTSPESGAAVDAIGIKVKEKKP